MESRKKWNSPQSFLVMVIIILIFTYITIDIAMTRPKIKSDINQVKEDYFELSGYVNSKIPEIDSALRIQEDQLREQGQDINTLNQRVKNLATDEDKEVDILKKE